MIRYVVAVLLAVAILGLAGLAIGESASDNTERELRSEIAAVEEKAIDLRENEEVSPAGHPNPQRVVELSIPSRSLTREGVSHFEIEPVDDADASVARYILDDGTRGEAIVNARIVYRDPTDDRPTEIGGSGTQRLRLVLLPDEDGDPVVVAEPPASVNHPQTRPSIDGDRTAAGTGAVSSPAAPAAVTSPLGTQSAL